MSVEIDAIPVRETRTLAPDPRIVDALAHNHSLSSALADLIDNSIDAAATRVLVRIESEDGLVHRIFVIDNGKGIEPNELDRVMTFGGSRTYTDSDLGHFGMGLKGASFSQADSLIVFSHPKNTDRFAGRRWLIHNAASDYSCDVLDESFARGAFEVAWWPHQGEEASTIVRWEKLRHAPKSADRTVHANFADNVAARVQRHLGLIFHRFLQSGALEIELHIVDVLDDAESFSSLPVKVSALDPFGYRVTGKQGYPRQLPVSVGDLQVLLTCHIWPGRADSANFKLGDSRPQQFSGLYVYKADRLLQAGSWNGLIAASRDSSLARVAVDIDANNSALFRFNPQKTAVEIDGELAHCIEAASFRGFNWNRYLQDARSVHKEAAKRNNRRRKVIPVKAGVPAQVRDALGRTFETLPGEDPMSIRWTRMSGEGFLVIDRDTRTVWLNTKYRTKLLAGRRGGLSDLPLIKVMLYLLTQDLFHGQFSGHRDRDEISILEEVLTAAVMLECSQHEIGDD
jgi:hypothetical protein